ncbi:protein FAM71E2 isoform X1 [Mustela putorius furo]|uniref:Protein FAM71E2 isoform X1 n=1 Tax=Mustela putorius furo TaxID=9669 RepID=A0A8U0UZ66_MUSPF|nr:protein FAM71E2 isoform X1 [Mustela putorius furo]
MNRFRNIKRMQPLQGPSKWVPTLGELQKTLQKGEYLPLRPLPMFESNFVQVNNRGAPVYVHHRTNRLTMGVAASLPGLVLPDILLIAERGEGRECSNLVLTRMLPLDLAHLYVHDLSACRLKLRLVTGRYYYLELDAPDNELGFLFDRWIRLINLLHEPATTWAPRTLSTPTMGLVHVVPPASTWRLQAQPQSKRSVMIAKPTFPYKLMASQRQKKTKTLKRRFKSQAVGDSVPLIWSHAEHAQAKKKPTEKSQPKLYLDTSQTKIQVSEKPSITIRTIFSIISNTINHTQSSSKGHSSDSEVGTVLGGLVETPVRCISEDSQEPSLVGSYDCLDAYLWQQDVEDLMDPDTSTLSSSSFSPAPGPPAFYFPHALPSGRKHKEKAGQRPRPLRSQKSPSTRATSSRVPFILDQSKKVSAVRAPSQKTSAAPGPSRRVPTAPGAPQKVPTAPGPPQKVPAARGPSRKATPVVTTSPKAPPAHGASRKPPATLAVSRKAQAIPAPSQKPPPMLASPQKPPAVPFLSQKSPPTLALPPKAVSPTLQRKKSLFIPTPSQKAVTSPSQYKMTPERADFGLGPKIGPRRDVAERRKQEGAPQPMLFVGTQEMDVLETRTQKTSMELPFTTTKKQSEEVVISKAREITLDGLKGRGLLEDKVHRKKEKISLDMPGFRSKERGERHRWLKTQELAIEGGPEEQSRPFSVEGLTLAKMMIMANCKEPPQRQAAVGLPSWLSAPQASMSAEGTGPFSPCSAPLSERKPVAARKQSPLGSWVPSSERKPTAVREQSPVGSWAPLMEGTLAGFKEQSPLSSWAPPMEGPSVEGREQSPVGSWVPSPERKPVAVREQTLVGSWAPLMEGTSVGGREQSPVGSWVPSTEGTSVGGREQSPVGSWAPSMEGTSVRGREQSPVGSWVPSPERKPVAVREQSPVGSWAPSMEGTSVGGREQSPVGSWVPSPERKPVAVREQSPVGSWAPSTEGTSVGGREQSPVGSWVPSPERKPVAVREQSPVGSWAPSTEGTSVGGREQSPVGSWVPSPERKPVAVREQSPVSSWAPSTEGTPAGGTQQSPVGSWVPSMEGTSVGRREQSPVGTWVKGKIHRWAERSRHQWAEERANVEELSQDTMGPSEVPYLPEQEMGSVSSSQKMDNVSLSPTPLPASEGEDTTRSPTSLTPVSEVGAGGSPPLSSLSQEPLEPKEMSDLSPVTTTGLSSADVSPSPLEVESGADLAASGDKEEEQDVFSPSASMLSTESPQ